MTTTERIGALTSEAAITAASHEDRRANVQRIAEGFIESARTQRHFGTVHGFNYAYFLGLTGGWYHGALISDDEMKAYRVRIDEAIQKRRGRRNR